MLIKDLKKKPRKRPRGLETPPGAPHHTYNDRGGRESQLDARQPLQKGESPTPLTDGEEK